MGKSRHWTDSFFTGLGLEVVRDPERERTAPLEADWIVRVLSLSAGDRLLDVPCGTGRMAAELARAGIRITGIDRSEVMISEARERCRGIRPPPVFRVGDMRELDEEPRYEAAIIWWGSFGYFSDMENLEILRRMVRALRVGGQLLVDTPNRERIRRYALGRHVVYFGEVKIVHDVGWRHDTSRIDGTWSITGHGRRKKLRSSIRLYTPGQMVELASRAGLGELRLYGDWTGRPYRRGSDRLVLYGRRVDASSSGG